MWIARLKNVNTMLRLGWHQHEKNEPQPVVVNVAMYSPTTAIRVDVSTIDDVVDYDPVRELILAWQKRAHIKLIEPLLLEVADCCFSQTFVSEVFVSILKTEIFPETEGAGVELTLTRHEWVELRRRK